MDSAEEFTGSNDHTLIVKGKRTKRQRPSSTSTSSTSAADAAGSGRDGVYFSIPSPMSSGEISTNTEEDEDMANCLILLAQGVFPSQLEDEEEEAEEGKIGKFSRPRYTDTAATTAGKHGCYIYECKTCDRTFPSFQALGGHRASHKRPKTAAEENRAIPATLPPPPPPEEKEDGGIKFMKLISHLNNKPKIHECSICGSEFSSGQALGGHMRRHRAAPNPRSTASIDRATTTVESGVERDDEKKKIFPLDLNLPAPIEEDHHREIKFQFFSGPTLVDCRY